MVNLGYVSSFNINGNELSLKDAALTEIVEEIIEAIGANNGDISDRINNLHERSFDALIKITSQNESEIESIQDGMYKLQYVTVTGEGDNATETLNNSAILIQTNIKTSGKGKGDDNITYYQYLYKNGLIFKRERTLNRWAQWSEYNIGVTSFNGATGAITYNAPVTSVNGQTGAVVIPKDGVTSFNGATGAITYSAPVTSVNGQTGVVITSLSSNYVAATGVNSTLELAAGDTYETAFGKLEKAITDNESVTSMAIDDLDDRLTELTNGIGDKNIIESISLNGITQTITNKNVNIAETKLSKGTTTGAGNAVTDITVSNHQITLVKGATYATQSDINTSIANLVDSAPETLNTLNELAAALGDDPNFATTVATQIGQKYTKPSLGIPASDLAEDAIPVTSVNGMTGAVILNSDDVNALHDYSKDYLTFIALENTTFTFTTNALQYSLDNGATWTTLSSNTTSPTVTAGNKILWKQTGLTPNSNYGIGTFGSAGTFNVSGNIMSLYYGDNFVGQTDLTGKDYAFQYLFNNPFGVVNAENLILPATTLASNCYKEMFNMCSSLTTAPELPATTLAENCYNQMFRDCTALTKAPELPATTLANYCYQSMFHGCTALTKAPELPATTLANSCYAYMFNGCTTLTMVPELPATALASSCYWNMFNGCTSLVTASELPATTLAPGCYIGMFSYCTSLTSAPELPIATLTEECYCDMFYGCTSLNYIKCLATDISASDCTYNWLYGVSSTGTFIKANSMTSWTTDNNGIPLGWNVHTESEYEVVRQYDVVHLTGNETISGDKIFTGRTILHGSINGDLYFDDDIYSDSKITLKDDGQAGFVQIRRRNGNSYETLQQALDARNNLITSVNGQTGAVTIDTSVTSFNGATGAITYTAPVTSVNGMTGVVTITETQLSKGTATGSGNVVTDITVSNHQITLVKGATYATQSDIDTSIAALVDSAPSTLDTLNELAAALGDDPNFATTIASQIGAKYTKPSTGIPSTDLANDVQTNLTLASTALQSFTETDPTVPSHVKNITSQDITNWNNKLSTAPVTSVNGQTGTVSLALGDTNVIETIKVNNTSLTPVSKAVNITVPTKVSDLTNDSNFTSNAGTITGITMNGVSKGTNGVVDLGTVLTEHQDISGKVDKVTGMGLSSNDYTTTEKNKLAGINIGSLDSLTTTELNSIFS